MNSIRLLRLDPTTEQALESHAKYIEAMATEDWSLLADAVQDVAGKELDALPLDDSELHWGGYVAADLDTRQFVGSCAFKSPPSGDGVVEIAYFTYPGGEGKGYTTAMAAKLIAIGSASPEVTGIIAHTLPEKSASTRLLEKNGMRLVGEVVDPEDGRVWRWEFAASSRP